MTFKYLKSLIPAAGMVLVLGTTSCVNELDISPINPQVNTDFVQDEVFVKVYATLGLTGQEGPAGSGDVAGIDEGTSAFYRLISVANENPTDMVHCCWGDPGIPEFNNIAWGASDNKIEGLYGRLNFDVTLCNHFLERTEGLTDDKSVKQRAEVRFMRALNLYYLMDLYGNVPFSETVSEKLPEQIKRADLFKYIEQELKAIEPDMYEPMQAPFGRADKSATWFLLSRMYLNAEVYTGTAQWGDAITYANKVIKESGRSLCENYAQLFMADNDQNLKARNEIIFPIRQDGIMTRSYGGSLYVIASTHTNGMNSWGTSEGWGGIRARKTLIDKFFVNTPVPMDADETGMVAAANDDRALFFAGGDRKLEIENVNSFKDGLSLTKWSNVRSDNASSRDPKFTDTDVPFFRLAEAYLTLAEATLRNGGPQKDALDAVNELRLRAHASTFATITLNMILDEKAREFYFEGQRRTDLVRYDYFTTNKYLWEWKGGEKAGTAVNSKFNIYPIPASDLNANKNLVQNPGY